MVCIDVFVRKSTYTAGYIDSVDSLAWGSTGWAEGNRRVDPKGFGYTRAQVRQWLEGVVLDIVVSRKGTSNLVGQFLVGVWVAANIVRKPGQCRSRGLGTCNTTSSEVSAMGEIDLLIGAPG